jgi:hypothetical protein
MGWMRSLAKKELEIREKSLKHRDELTQLVGKKGEMVGSKVVSVAWCKQDGPCLRGSRQTQ